MYIFSRAILPFTCSRSSVGFLQRRKWQKAPEAASGEGSRAPPSDAAGPLRPASTISSVPAAARLTPPSQLYLGPGRSRTRHPSSVQGSEIPLCISSTQSGELFHQNLPAGCWYGEVLSTQLYLCLFSGFTLCSRPTGLLLF